MLAALLRFFSVLAKSLAWLAPVLKAILPAAIGASISVYGIWSILYSVISSNIDGIEGIFDQAISALNHFNGMITASGTGSFFCYVVAFDTLLTILAVDLSIVMVFLNFLFVGLVAIIVGFVVKLISVQIAKFIARNISLSSFDPTQGGPV